MANNDNSGEGCLIWIVAVFAAVVAVSNGDRIARLERLHAIPIAQQRLREFMDDPPPMVKWWLSRQEAEGE